MLVSELKLNQNHILKLYYPSFNIFKIYLLNIYYMPDLWCRGLKTIHISALLELPLFCNNY